MDNVNHGKLRFTAPSVDVFWESGDGEMGGLRKKGWRWGWVYMRSWSAFMGEIFIHQSSFTKVSSFFFLRIISFVFSLLFVFSNQFHSPERKQILFF